MRKFIARLLVMLISGAGLLWFAVPIFWNVKNIGNITGMTVCAALFLIALFYPLINRLRKSSKPFHIVCRVVSVLFIIGAVWTALLTGFMLYGANTFGTSTHAPKDATVVVLGSKVSGKTPSADLQARIDAAAAYLRKNPEARCVVSGGKGAGELVTEASVMREYLMKAGIDASRIFTEDTSTNTAENLKNTLSVITKNRLNRTLAIVTDEYHEFRAGKIAEKLGAKAHAVSAQTPWYIFSACYARELFALTKFLIMPS